MIATITGETATIRQADSELPDGFEDMAHVCKMLADPSRLRIVFFLLNRAEMNVGDICDRLEQSQPAVSHHLALMKRAGLVQVRRDGKRTFYSLVRERFQGVVLQIFEAISDTPNGGLKISDEAAGWSFPAPKPSAV